MTNKTFRNYLNLIFTRSMVIKDKKYRLPYYVSFIKEMLNLIYVLGGFLIVGGSISIFLQSLNIELPFGIVISLTIFIPLLVNFVIVYFSPLVEVKDNNN